MLAGLGSGEESPERRRKEGKIEDWKTSQKPENKINFQSRNLKKQGIEVCREWNEAELWREEGRLSWMAGEGQGGCRGQTRRKTGRGTTRKKKTQAKNKGAKKPKLNKRKNASQNKEVKMAKRAKRK